MMERPCINCTSLYGEHSCVNRYCPAPKHYDIGIRWLNTTFSEKFNGLSKIICIDFDGTIVESRFPEIGPVMTNAFEVMKELQSNGYKLILFTCRCDGNTIENRSHLQEAIKFCSDNGVDFHSVNSNRLEDVEGFGVLTVPERHKPYADIYIDDKNLGGFPGWDEVRKILIGVK